MLCLGGTLTTGDRLKDKFGNTALDLVPNGDDELRTLIRKTRALNSLSNSDIADDSDGEHGSGSDEV